MPQVFYGRKGEPGLKLEESPDLIAVRTRSRRSVSRSASPVTSPVAALVADCDLVLEFPEAGVEVYRVPVPTASGGKRSSTRGASPVMTLDARKAALRAAPDVRFAGGVLVDANSHRPVLYTENIFIKFQDSADPAACRAVLQAQGLAIKSEPSYAVNAFFVEAPEGTGQKVFDIAAALLQRADVEYCHPELVRERQSKLIFAAQWHLKKTTVAGVVVDAHANVEAAHALTRGEGITVAVIDDGIDIDHVEFAGAGKVVAAQNMLPRGPDPRPRRADNNHGTACAGVAVANGSQAASGVAPAARLMPIRLLAGLGSQAEAEAFRYAADMGADIISCSWGPPDGAWWDPKDPDHNNVDPQPTSTRLAVEYAATQGRGGKGCILLYAAGNGNESADNDGYASNPHVLAIAACNDRGRRAIYSDFGRAVWCSFPSNDFELPEVQHPAPLTPGIWTTDRLGEQGYNKGRADDGDAAGAYTNSFGGTSSACPGVAGVAALVLAINPALQRLEVADILKRACDRIDPAGGQYNSAGRSAFYGWGRLNALTAVQLAQPQPRNEVTVSRRFDAPLPSPGSADFVLDVTGAASASAVSVAVDISHARIGDLVLTLQGPAASGVGPVLLRRRSGGAGTAVRKVFDKTTTPALAQFDGKPGNGRWTLTVQDARAADKGVLVSFSVRVGLGLGKAGPGAGAPVRAKVRPAKAPKKLAPATTPAPRATRKR